jgi:hypothetical protein
MNYNPLALGILRYEGGQSFLMGPSSVQVSGELTEALVALGVPVIFRREDHTAVLPEVAVRIRIAALQGPPVLPGDPQTLQFIWSALKIEKYPEVPEELKRCLVRYQEAHLDIERAQRVAGAALEPARQLFRQYYLGGGHEFTGAPCRESPFGYAVQSMGRCIYCGTAHVRPQLG